MSKYSTNVVRRSGIERDFFALGVFFVTLFTVEVHDSPYHLCAMSVPQASVDPQQLKSITMAVAKSCCNRGIIGYVCVDFVTFIDPLTVATTRFEIINN